MVYEGAMFLVGVRDSGKRNGAPKNVEILI